MREIKFRGKELKNCKWRYGNLHIVERGSQCHIVDFGNIYPIEEKDTTIQYGGVLNWWEVEPETVGQFTGLKDKNGVEIYEGDIVRFCDDPPYFSDYIIKYDEERLLWIADGVNDFTNDLWELECEFVRVIGNIHDNLSLLNSDL